MTSNRIGGLLSACPVKLDQIDFEILRILQQDARVSNKELAQLNGISPSTCLERVRRLKEQRVLKRFCAEVSPKALGIGVEAMISIQLRQHAGTQFEEIFREIAKLNEVVNVYLLAGAVDLLVHVAVRDVEHLRSLVVETFTARYKIDHMETSLVFQFEHCPTLPNYQTKN